MKNQSLFLAGLAASLMAIAPAQAAITVLDDSQGAIQPDENVLFPTRDVSGTTVVGETNNTATEITFESPSETVVAPSGGQARVEADDGSLSALSFYLTEPGVEGFTQFEFNLFKPLGDVAQTVTITVTYYSAMLEAITDFTFDLDGNGENFMIGNATDGDYFTKVSWETSGIGVTDQRQTRIGGIVYEGMAPVPEPATWALLIIGFAAMGAMMRRRKSQTLSVTYG